MSEENKPADVRSRVYVVADVTLELYRKDHHDSVLIWEIVEAASQYFTECPEDFCLQSFSGQVIVFGGVNRLIWSPSTGFRPDRSYCTEKFLMRCAALGYLPKP